MPTDDSRRKIMLLPMLALIALAVAWSCYWLVASELGKRMAATKRAELQQVGVSLFCRDEAWGGYPFRFELDCHRPVLTFRDGAEIAFDQLRAVTMAYNPWHVLLLIEGPTTLDTPLLGQTSIEHGRAVISLTFSNGDAPRLSAEVQKPVIRDVFLADRIMLHTRPVSHATEIALSIEGFLHKTDTGPEISVDRAELIGTLGSELLVEKLSLEHDKVRLWGEGNVLLDPERRFAGKLSMQTNDLSGFLDILEPHLTLTERQRASMRTVLGLLGNATRADIVAQQGQLFLGPFKVADLTALF